MSDLQRKLSDLRRGYEDVERECAAGVEKVATVAKAVQGAEKERRTVMVVDDEPMILESLAALLGKEFAVTRACCAAQGLELLGEHGVDLVISDNRMPGMGGCEFLSLVRDLSPTTIRFLMTGYPDLEIMAAIEKGVIAKYLPKPWCNKGLKKAVSEALDLQALKAKDRDGRLEARVQMARVLEELENVKRRY